MELQTSPFLFLDLYFNSQAKKETPAKHRRRAAVSPEALWLRAQVNFANLFVLFLLCLFAFFLSFLPFATLARAPFPSSLPPSLFRVMNL